MPPEEVELSCSIRSTFSGCPNFCAILPFLLPSFFMLDNLHTSFFVYCPFHLPWMIIFPTLMYSFVGIVKPQRLRADVAHLESQLILWCLSTNRLKLRSSFTIMLKILCLQQAHRVQYCNQIHPRATAPWKSRSRLFQRSPSLLALTGAEHYMNTWWQYCWFVVACGGHLIPVRMRIMWRNDVCSNH